MAVVEAFGNNLCICIIPTPSSNKCTHTSTYYMCMCTCNAYTFILQISTYKTKWRILNFTNKNSYKCTQGRYLKYNFVCLFYFPGYVRATISIDTNFSPFLKHNGTSLIQTPFGPDACVLIIEVSLINWEVYKNVL